MPIAAARAEPAGERLAELLEEIRGDARRRLALAPDTHPSQEVARYKKFLKLETHRLKMLHRTGGGGREVCRARATVLDLLLCHSLAAVQPPAGSRAAARTYALVAIGGYGRGELNPCSDLDIMFLVANEEGVRAQSHAPHVELLTGGFLWDVGLKVGQSVRTVADCVTVAKQDMQSKTSLIEARLICGERALFEQLQRTVLNRCVKGHEHDYIQARLADQEARRAKYGNSACMQEPNVKNGCGGLRDYQNLLWMAYFKYRIQTLAELSARDQLSETERQQLEAAYDFLLRVRNELHYHTGRAADVLSKSVQPAVARNLGYTERSPSRRIEQFMRDYYTHSRHIYLITRTLEQRLALLPQPNRLPTWKQFLRQRRHTAMYPVDGFKFVDGHVCAAHDRTFEEQPARLMRAFRHAQQRGLGLDPDLAQTIRRRLALVNEAFRHDSHIRETFLEILDQRGNVARVLRTMHELGLLGRYLPSFGKLTCLVQHEFFHQYAADEHTLICLEKLDALWGAQDPPHGLYADLFQKIERPHLLYLALLLHDAGKASRARDHSLVGSRIARGVAERLGLDAAATQTLCLLIRQHLAMIQISQRRDLDDPGEIRRFAGQVGSIEHLNLLTLLTYADARGTSEQLWNSFKDSLLWTLYRRTHELLTGSREFARLEAEQRELLAGEVERELAGEIAADEVTAHFAGMPPRYFRVQTVKEIAADLRLARAFLERQLAEHEDPLEPVLTWQHQADRGYSEVKICTWDRHGLFSKITGALTAAGLNIHSAEIFTRADDLALDSFWVTDALTGTLANADEQARFQRCLNEVLAGQLNLADLLRRRPPVKPLYSAHEGERIPTQVRFDNTASDQRTVLEIETEDRLGLLYTISQVLSELGVDIFLAKICTEKGAAIDTFYLGEAGGGQIRAGDRLRQIGQRLRAAIQRLE
ncbi:MAG: [protein-PII] uridylyltransferase [Verrucomicrobia bacterium]|nr:[protein-PII] uridylyltransferase [Verrucomicrobiota bacterium]